MEVDKNGTKAGLELGIDTLVVMELETDWPAAGLELGIGTLVVMELDTDWLELGIGTLVVMELDTDWVTAELVIDTLVVMELDTNRPTAGLELGTGTFLLSLWWTSSFPLWNTSITALSRFLADIKRTSLEAKRSSSSRLLERESKSPGDINEIIF